MKYQVIAQHAQDYPVKLMCQTLEVSESGYYAWKRRPLSYRAQANQQIASHIQQVHQASHQIYGSRRIQAELADQGIACSRKRVVRLMQQQGIRARRRHTTTTDSQQGNTALNSSFLCQRRTAQTLSSSRCV